MSTLIDYSMDTKRIYKSLEKFGLSQNEVKIYLETLKEDDLSPYKLAILTKIPRTTVYEIIAGLALKGLITLDQSDGFTKQQTRVKAKNPSILRSILRQKRKDLSRTEIDIVEILPLLKGDFHKDEANADFQFLPGIKGAKKIYFDEIQTSEPVVAFENLMPMDVFGKEEINEDVRQQSEITKSRKVYVREIVPINDWSKHVLSYQYGRDKNYIKARNIRFVDNPVFELNQRISVQGTRLRIICAKDDEVWGIIINSQTLSKTIVSIFEVVWQNATNLTPEMIESWGENEFLEAEKKKTEKSSFI